MGKVSIAVLFMLSFAPSSRAQTAANWQMKFTHHEVYEVRPGVQVAARFAPNGLVCEIRLEPSYFSKNTVNLSFGIDRDAINSILEDLVPSSERGKEDRTDPDDGVSLGLGQISEEIHSYLNVRVHVLSSHDTTVAYVHWRHRNCDSLLSEEQMVHRK
ncbi:MAG: hypothetical protein WBD25_20285 [Terriglobales bacterium]|jgi:hypothetical protein